MPTPLAPVVHGPILVTSPAVLVSGVLAQATVELLVGDTAVGMATAVGNGDLWVSLVRELSANNAIVAVQSLGGRTSLPSNYPVPVLPVPAALPAPVFLSPMSQFMSHVLLRGLVPGARIEVRRGNVLAGSAIARGASTWLAVDPAVLIDGAVLTAVQRLGDKSSPVTTSVELAEVNARLVPTPKIEEPVRACDTSLHVLDCIPAADLVAENAGNSVLWTAISDQFWATGAREFKPGPLRISQRLPGTGVQSDELVLTVEEAVAPPAPLLNRFCPESRRLVVSGLKPGGVLTLWEKVWNEEDETELGSIGIGKIVEQIDLPKRVGGSGPLMAIIARQSTCGLTSPSGLATEFARPGSSVVPLPAPRIRAPLYDCSRTVPCEDLAMVQARLVSSLSGQPLSDWEVPSTTDTPLHAWFPLVAGDVVRVEQLGCGAPDSANEERVHTLPSPLPQPIVVGPVRPGAVAVSASGVLPGARVHLMVDGVVRVSLDALSDQVVFQMGRPLHERAHLWAFQTLCADASPREGRGILVTRGQLAVDVSQTQVNGGVPVPLLVNVRDAEDGKVLAGLPVQIGGVTVGHSGTTFSWMPPAAGSQVSGLVIGGEAYHDATFSIAIRPGVSIALGLYPGEGAAPGTVAMIDVEWQVEPAWSGGAVKTLASATGAVTIEGSPPGGVVAVSLRLKVQLAADPEHGLDAETVDLRGGLLTNLALIKPAHAVSAILVVRMTSGVNSNGIERYRRSVQVRLLTVG